jgi:CheY-like chemotaxis protein
MPTILCIDDQPVGLAIRKALLESKGYKAVTAENGPDGIAFARKHQIDAVVLDYRMPGMYGGRRCRNPKKRTSGPSNHTALRCAHPRPSVRSHQVKSNAHREAACTSGNLVQFSLFQLLAHKAAKRGQRNEIVGNNLPIRAQALLSTKSAISSKPSVA